MTPAPPSTAPLAANRSNLRKRIEQAAVHSNREPAAIEVIAVTKSVTPQVALALFQLGETQLAENRLEKLDEKRAAFDAADLSGQPTWHFIGRVQRNKARRVIERSDVIHSIDSVKLLKHCARIAAELGRRPAIYLQVKLTDDDAKFGLDRADLPAAIDAAIAASDSLELRGLMVMAPLAASIPEHERRQAAQHIFQQAADLASQWPELKLGLSMGMTGDFEEAIDAGSTAIRVGSAFFLNMDSAS